MDGFFDFFKQNPNYIGLFLAAVGILLFVGALLKWQWVISPGRKFSLLRWLVGPRGEMFVASSVLIVGGIALFIAL